MLEVLPKWKVCLKKKSHCILILLMTKVSMTMSIALDVGGGVGVVQKSLSLLQTRIRMLSRLVSKLCKIGVGGGVL